MHHLRKLLVLGINELIAQGKLDLSDPAMSTSEEDGHIFADLADHKSMIAWTDIGHEELRISVWWKYNHDRHPQKDLHGNHRENFTTTLPLAKSAHFPKFVGACVSGWLERKEGNYLQGTGKNALFDTYIRKGEADSLKNLEDPKPRGFSAEGKFHF